MFSSSDEENTEGLERIPDLEIAQIKFLLQNGNQNSVEYKQSLLKAIAKDNMAPFYIETCKDLNWSEDSSFLQKMKNENEVTLKALNDKISDAEANLGESEIRDALLAKAVYLTKIGSRNEAKEALQKTMVKTVGLGNRMDLLFHNIRLGLFYMDHSFIQENIKKATECLESGGDWDRRNRLKVYEGLYAMAIRNFPKAASLFLETISTFTSYELMNYVQFVKYAVISSVIALERRKLTTDVIKGSEILEVLHSLPDIRSYLFSLFECRYGEFFQHLASLESILASDRYLHPHYAYYVREMKIKALSQHLETYRSLTLSYMAESFGVTEKYMDAELAKYIADGRLRCKIDKVRSIVITNRLDSKNSQYQSIIRQGDIVLNRVQKLSRVINI